MTKQDLITARDRAIYRVLPDGRFVLRDAELHQLLLEYQAQEAGVLANSAFEAQSDIRTR